MFSKFSSLEKTLGNAHRPFRYRVELEYPQEVKVSHAFFSDDTVNTLVKSTRIPGVRIQQRNFYSKGHILPLNGIKIYDQDWDATFMVDDDFTVRYSLERWITLIDSFMSGELKSDVGFMDSIMDKGMSIIKDINPFKPAQLSDILDTSKAGVTTTELPLGDRLLNATKKASDSILNDTITKDSDNHNRLYGTIRITPLSINDSSEIYTYVLHNAFPIALQPIQLDDASTSNISEFTCSFAFSHYTVEKPVGILDLLPGMDSVKGALNSGADSIANAIGGAKKYFGI